jgi:sugar-specific transcriptional regulator TrmB
LQNQQKISKKNNFNIIENQEKIEENAEKFLQNFEKEIFKLLEKEEEKTSIFPQISQKLKKGYKIFSKKYVVFDAETKRIIFSNLDNLEKFDFKKIS